MSSIVECFTFQIAKAIGFSQDTHYPGNVYDYQWLVDSAAEGQLVSPEPYLLKHIEFTSNEMTSSQSKGQQRTRFTIRELIKIFEVTS